MIVRVAVFAACALAAASAAWAADGPRVVASVKPLHSLVSGVMKGVGEPALLIKGGASPHTYSFKPSDAVALNAADVVFWVGPGFENFLARPLGTLAGKARAVAMAEARGMILLPTREGGVLRPGEAAHDAHAEHGGVDGHVWLDPRNAKAMTAEIVRVLSETDPPNAETYARNGAVLAARIEALDGELEAVLAPVGDKPFVLFHDALQYYQVRYGLNVVGTVTVSPDRMPGARRILEIREHISALGAVCIFAEPQFEPRLIRALEADTGARSGTLDPEGGLLEPGEDQYFGLMRGLAENLAACLASA